jgi:hypothetical protein
MKVLIFTLNLMLEVSQSRAFDLIDLLEFLSNL